MLPIFIVSKFTDTTAFECFDSLPMANPSEPLALGYNYDDTQSLSDAPTKTIANSMLSLRLCEILQCDNSMCLLMAGSSLSTREVTCRLAVVTDFERQSPPSSTPNEVQPPIARWKSSRLANSPIRTSNGQKIGSTTSSCHPKNFERTLGSKIG